MKLLVKEIKSKEGELHFRRWRLLELPFFRIYVHGIYKSDDDKFPHSHPWSFVSLILRGGYHEKVGPLSTDWNTCLQGNVVYHHYTDTHKLQLIESPTYTLVFAWGFKKPWGFRVRNQILENEFIVDELIDNEEYRKIKEHFDV